MDAASMPMGLGGVPQGSSALGTLITSRGQGAASRVVTVVVLSVLILGCAVGAVFAAVAVLAGKWVALVGLVLAAGFGFLCLAGLKSAFRTVEFYEGGAVEILLGRRREVLYQNVTQMSYGIVRQYVNGVYAGTTVNMQLRQAQGPKLGYGGRYKEKPKGWAMTVFGRKFEGADELDVIRDVVAAHVANRLMDQIARGEPVVWAGCATITADGITPTRGRRKGQLVPWSQFAGLSMDKGTLHLFATGDKKSFLDVVVGAGNVFPVIELIGTMTGGGQDQVEPGA